MKKQIPNDNFRCESSSKQEGEANLLLSEEYKPVMHVSKQAYKRKLSFKCLVKYTEQLIIELIKKGPNKEETRQ